MPRSLEFVKNRPDIQKVILSGNWYEHLAGNGHYFDDGLKRYPISLNSTGYALALDALGRYIKTLQRSGKKFILF